MKKIIFLFFIFFFLLSPFDALGQNKSSGEIYSELLSKYRQYQGQLEPFSSTKSRYLAYQSVSAQSEFLEVSKQLIRAEIEAMHLYADFVKKYLAEATQILNYDENYIYVKLDDEITYLNLAGDRVNSIETLADAESFLKELEVHYQRISLLGYQAKAIIEIGSTKKIFNNFKVERGKIDNFLSSTEAAQSKISASKEKLVSLDKDVDTVSGLIKTTETSYQHFDYKNSKAKSNEIWETLAKSMVAMKSLLRGYRDIILNFK